MSSKFRRDLEPDSSHEPPRSFTYGKPSTPAWVAAAAVAFAVFLLGGFIKTYRQLEELRAESRKEIAELRDAVRRLQAQQVTIPSPPQRGRLPGNYQQPAPERYPQPPVNERSRRPDADSGAVMLRPEKPGNASESTLADLPAFDDPEPRGIRYQWGRRSNGQASRVLTSPAGGSCQVISVSGENKRIMIEGGRDLSLREGARLELCRDGRWIADLRVQDVFDNQSSCEVLHATQTPEPGDTVRMPEKSM